MNAEEMLRAGSVSDARAREEDGAPDVAVEQGADDEGALGGREAEAEGKEEEGNAETAGGETTGSGVIGFICAIVPTAVSIVVG